MFVYVVELLRETNFGHQYWEPVAIFQKENDAYENKRAHEEERAESWPRDVQVIPWRVS